jgi:prepilin-type N-terminal cleavage/methylation domain-containing protein
MRISLKNSRVELLNRSADFQSAYCAKIERSGTSLDLRCSMLDLRCSRFQKAFTLLEVVISATLMAIILVSAYACFDAGIRGKRMIEPRVEVFQNARVAMALLTADLRNACPLSKDFDFLGMHRTIGSLPADNLDFATHNYTPKGDREADFCETSFYVEKDPATGRLTLFRRRNPILAPDPLSGGSKEEIATGLLGARFEYSDGLDWYDTWGEIKGTKQQTSNRDQPNLSGMPEAVRITLWFDSDPQTKITGSETSTNRPMAFQTVARLMLADAPQQSSSSSSSADTGSSDQNQSAPGTPPGGMVQ